MRPVFAVSASSLLLSLVAVAHSATVTPGTFSDPDVHQHRLTAGVKVSSANYAVPDLTMIRDDGLNVGLRSELDDGRPVIMNFIFTDCPGICPMMSQILSDFQTRLGAEREHVHMVSISIDPEQDTPARLREYAKKFSAGSQWQHYTGTVAASVTVQKAFGAYRGDKMSHDPLTLMRPAPGKPWLRIDGLASGIDLLQQYMALGSVLEGQPR